MSEQSDSQRDEDDLLRRIEARRSDPEFMGRLQRILEENREVLERLAERDGSS